MAIFRHPLTCLLLVVFLVAGSGSTSYSVPPEEKASRPQSALIVDNETYIDANRILMFVTNHGNFGRDIAGVFGNDYGTYFPFTSIENIESGANVSSVLYAGGLWLGGIDYATGDTLVTVSEYFSEYVPGPMAGGTYQTDRPEFRVYKLFRDSLADNPNQDYLDWPVAQGAPVDLSGSPAINGDHFTWAVYNDAKITQHEYCRNGNLPLGIEVHQSVFSFARWSGAMANAVFLRFKLVNKGQRPFRNFCISLWLDPDIGNSENDRVGCDTSRDIFFCYNGTNSEPDFKYPPVPPAVGFKLVEGPLVASPGDVGELDGRPVPGYRNLRLRSFCAFVNGTDPDNCREAYLYMNGLDGKNNGAAFVNPETGLATRFMYPGDPGTLSGWLDGTAGDKRMMATVEPFTFGPGQTQQVTFAMMVGQGGSYLSSVVVMRALMDMMSLPTDVEEDPVSALPSDFHLFPNYPNPFNPATTLRYALPTRCDVEVAVFNVLGRRVATLVCETQSAGEHTVVWNSTDDKGRTVASGVYFYRVRAGDDVQSRKMVLLK